MYHLSPHTIFYMRMYIVHCTLYNSERQKLLQKVSILKKTIAPLEFITLWSGRIGARA